MFYHSQNLPPIRGSSRKKEVKKKKSKPVKIGSQNQPRIKSYDFKAWDKFDVVSQFIRIQETKTFTMLGEVGMANESTKTTQTSVWMAQHNERTRLHDLSCTPTNLRVH